MGERFAAEITIGGEIKEELISPIAGLLDAENVQPGWGEGSYNNAAEIEAEIRAGVCRFRVDEQSWGEFPELEAFLEENNIAFDRQHAARYEYQGEVVKFRPGMDIPVTATALDSGKQTIPASLVLNLLKYDTVKTIKEKINELCNAEMVPGLEPLKITE